MKWTARPRIDWSKVETLEKRIPLDRISDFGIAPYSNWFLLREKLVRLGPEERERVIVEYIKIYEEHKPIIDEMMRLMFTDVPPDWFDITLELTGVTNVEGV